MRRILYSPIYDQKYVLIVRICHVHPLLWLGLHSSSRRFVTLLVTHYQHCYVSILDIFDSVPYFHLSIQGFSVMIFYGTFLTSFLIYLVRALFSITQALFQLIFSFCLFLYRASSFFMLDPLFSILQVFFDTFYSCAV